MSSTFYPIIRNAVVIPFYLLRFSSFFSHWFNGYFMLLFQQMSTLFFLSLRWWLFFISTFCCALCLTRWCVVVVSHCLIVIALQSLMIFVFFFSLAFPSLILSALVVTLILVGISGHAWKDIDFETEWNNGSHSCYTLTEEREKGKKQH